MMLHTECLWPVLIILPLLEVVGGKQTLYFLPFWVKIIFLRQLLKNQRMSCNHPRVTTFAEYLSDHMLCAYLLKKQSDQSLPCLLF